tara:strand:+ start:751 stop:960 length:210 start_codon:yes stop_codon:yes gene_type:complete
MPEEINIPEQVKYLATQLIDKNTSIHLRTNYAQQIENLIKYCNSALLVYNRDMANSNFKAERIRKKRAR